MYRQNSSYTIKTHHIPSKVIMEHLNLEGFKHPVSETERRPPGQHVITWGEGAAYKWEPAISIEIYTIHQRLCDWESLSSSLKQLSARTNAFQPFDMESAASFVGANLLARQGRRTPWSRDKGPRNAQKTHWNASKKPGINYLALVLSMCAG